MLIPFKIVTPIFYDVVGFMFNEFLEIAKLRGRHGRFSLHIIERDTFNCVAFGFNFPLCTRLPDNTHAHEWAYVHLYKRTR